MTVKSIFLSGYSGRMGQEIRKIAETRPEFASQIVGGLDSDRTFGLDEPINVVIDFSLPQALSKIVNICLEKKWPIVCGTTGLSDTEMALLEKLGETVPVFWSSNMSLGVFLFHKLIQTFPGGEASGFRFSIHEVHHTKKRDQPSGTALSLGQTAEKAGLTVTEITSDRQGDVPGTHWFYAKGLSETITITHEAHNRAVFAEGALAVSRWLANQNPGFYGMEDYVNSLG